MFNISSITIKDLIVSSFIIIWFVICNIFLLLDMETAVMLFQMIMILLFGVIVLIDRISIKANEWMTKIIWVSKYQKKQNEIAIKGINEMKNIFNIENKDIAECLNCEEIVVEDMLNGNYNFEDDESVKIMVAIKKQFEK